MSLAFALETAPVLGVRARADALLEAAQGIRRAELSDIPEPRRLEIVAHLLAELARRPGLFPPHAFPLAEGSVGGLYRLVEFADGETALYMSVGVTGRKAPPHTHAAWAAVAGVSGGVELNRVYERIDDGRTPGQGRLALRAEKAVGPGELILLPSGAFHTIEVASDTPVLHLHAYARPVDAPTDRPLPVFEHPEATTYALRESSRFPPRLSTVTWREAIDDVAAGHAAALGIGTGFSLEGPHVDQAATPRAARDVLERLAPPKNTPVILLGREEDLPDAAATIVANGYPIVFQLR